MPAGFAANGLPIAAILSSRPGTDRDMCAWARDLAQLSK